MSSCTKRGCDKFGSTQLTGFSFEPDVALEVSQDWWCPEHFNEMLEKLGKRLKRDLSYLEEE